MNLDNLWHWTPKPLNCRLRAETGNPAGDDLRERFAELAKADFREILNEMKVNKRKTEADPLTMPNPEKEKNFKELLERSHILGATQIALTEMEKFEQSHKHKLADKNIKKRYVVLPKSPPRRVQIDIQRERAKLLKIQDEETENDQEKTTHHKPEKKVGKKRFGVRNLDLDEKQDQEKHEFATLVTQVMTMEEVHDLMKPYQGDLFGSGGPYLESMLYLSRMKDSSQRVKVRADGKRVTTTDIKNERDSKVQRSSEGQGNDDFQYGDSSEEQPSLVSEAVSSVTDVSAKLYCAACLCNWARNPANATRLASEGAVGAIMRLCLEENPRILMFCMAAFRYMSEHTPLALAMIEEGAISTMNDVINTNMQPDEFIAGNIVVALVNLTRISGKEGQMIEGLILLALTGAIIIQPELCVACARGLYNLTCVDNTYPQIDKVIRQLVQLAQSSTVNVKHICAAALCNLSDLKLIRIRMLEDGVIDVLGKIAKGSETRTRRICAVVLQNLSAYKPCRMEMVSRSCITVCLALSSDQDPIILRCVGLTIARLSLDHVNCSRIINDSGITALCNIAVKYPTVPGISQPVAAAFRLLSNTQSVRTVVVQEGSVTAIATLLRVSVDLFTLQNILLALCNLLSEVDNHLPIVQQGLILTLITLCSQENEILRDLSALAFLNLSRADDSRKHLVNAGAMPAIINLSQFNSTVTQSRCAATLCNVSAYETGMARMVGDGIVSALVKLVLADDLITVRYACAALCRICSSVENGNLILESGAVPNLVQRALGGDDITKQFCGAVLSALSIYESCRIKLCELDVMSAMLSLANVNDLDTKKRCLIAFANISCEETMHTKMVEQGVIEIIARLSTTYIEDNFMFCAKTLCNLSCTPALRLRIAAENGIQVLMMISLVQSVNLDTKLLCVVALSNLLDETTLDVMLAEGLVSSLANLAKINDERVVNTCARIFNQLTMYPDGAAKIVDKTSYMSSMFTMLGSDNMETKILTARTTCNLLLNEDVRSKALRREALAVLQDGAQIPDEDASKQCVIAIFTSCTDVTSIHSMAMSNVHMQLADLGLQCMSSEKHSFICKILCLFSWTPESRIMLQNSEFVQKLVGLLNACENKDCIYSLLETLKYVCLDYPRDHLEDMLNAGVVNCLCQIKSRYAELSTFYPTKVDKDKDSTDYDFEIATCCAEIVRCLTESEATSASFGTEETMMFLSKMTELSKTNEDAMYEMGVALMRICFSGTEARQAMARVVTEAVDIFDHLSKVRKCDELLISSMYCCLSDHKARAAFSIAPVACIVMAVINANVKEDLLNNAVTVVYTMARQATARDMLSNNPVNANAHLLSISEKYGDNVKLQANCARTLKNLNSDANDALEEGAVKALISMSLEGKRTKVGDELQMASCEPVVLVGRPVPSCKHEAMMVQDRCWFANKIVTPGGDAGKGPEAPQPTMDEDDKKNEYNITLDELESGDAEGRTKMAFAKMQPPADLREKYQLTETDFALTDPSEESDSIEDGNSADVPKLTDGSEPQVGLDAMSPITAPPTHEEEPAVSVKSMRGKSSKSMKTFKGSRDDGDDDSFDGNVSPKSKKKKAPGFGKGDKDDVPIGDKAAQLGLYT
jgi:hypothetical protein